MIRTGIGYDVHKLIKGDSLIVGSVEIPSVSNLLDIQMAIVLFML